MKEELIQKNNIFINIFNYSSKAELKEIYIPKHLFSKGINNIKYKQFKTNLIPKLIDEIPPIIKNLKTMIINNTVINNTKIKIFN